MRRAVVLGFEAMFIGGLLVAGVLVLPWVAWRWLCTPRQWREPRDVGVGFYEHP